MPPRLAIPLASLALLALTFAVQWNDHAYRHDLSFDSASHALSGLMVRDWIAGASWGEPVAYVRAYHSHYPLIGIGHWPPLWYGVEAAWMLAAGAGRAPLLVQEALVTAATASITAVLAARRFGWWAGTVAGVAVVIAPLMRETTGDVLLDGPVALLCLLAMLAYARFLRSVRATDAAVFGLLAAAAILIKGNGALLALLPPLALLVGRRFDLLRRWAFWLPLPIVALLAGPWVAATSGQVEAGFRFGWGLRYAADASLANAAFLANSLGAVPTGFAAVGIYLLVRRGHGRDDPTMVCAAALFLATFLFQAIVPAALQDRYLAPMVPPAMLLILAAWRVQKPSLRWTPGVWASVLLILFLLASLRGHGFGDHPMRDGAEAVWAHRPEANPVVLVAAEDEGSAIVELALRDPRRPSLFAVRGSRLLGGGGYNQSDYEPRFATAAEVMAALDEHAIPLVLLRRSGEAGEWAHLGQLAQARAAQPERWRLVWEDRATTPPVQLYEIVGNVGRIADTRRLLALSAPRGLGK